MCKKMCISLYTFIACGGIYNIEPLYVAKISCNCCKLIKSGINIMLQPPMKIQKRLQRNTGIVEDLEF